jgi:hypothetical protein
VSQETTPTQNDDPHESNTKPLQKHKSTPKSEARTTTTTTLRTRESSIHTERGDYCQKKERDKGEKRGRGKKKRPTRTT